MIEELLSAIKQSEWHEAERILMNYWMLQCPWICVPTSDTFDFIMNENAFNDKLIHPIACAYCLDENVKMDLKPLNYAFYGSQSTKSHLSFFCGHVFKSGETTYSCKECAADATCVMCYECFSNSAHKSHRYRIECLEMAASSGNGYCDCGDVEAWKEHPACKLHEVNQEEENSRFIFRNHRYFRVENLTGEDKKELEKRVYSLTRIILQFAIKVICWTDDDFLPTFMRDNSADSTLPPYQTILMNDETHTYDSVIRALNLSINCTETEAMHLATIIDREGRASVRNGSMDYCRKAREEIQRRTQRDSNHRTEKSGPLNVRVIDSRFISLQNFAVRLVGWLKAQTRCFPALAFTVGDILLNEKISEDTDETLMIHAMKHDSVIWKGARIIFHQIIMATVLMNNQQKQQFATLYVQLYKKVYDDFIDDDLDHSVSITALTVQIFTVPTLARFLIAEESVLKVIFDSLISRCEKYLKVPEKMKFDFSSRSYPHALRRSIYMLYDGKYLLSVVPSKEEWSPLLRENFIDGCSSLIRFLSFMQGMDDVRRQTSEHQTWEQEWETAFNIQIKLQHVLTLVIFWANSDVRDLCLQEIVHYRLMTLLLEELEAITSRCPEFIQLTSVEGFTLVNDIKATCIPFDMSLGTLSVHQPHWRLLAGLFTAPQSFLRKVVIQNVEDVEEKVPEMMINMKGRRALLLEMPLRIFVLCSQSQAQMWRRNGFSLVNQIHNYSAPLCRAEMFDRDVLLMQVCAALTPPDIFIIRVLYRFGLHVWALPNYEEVVPGVVASDDSSRCTITLAEEMLQLFIIVIGMLYSTFSRERYLPGVGKSTAEDLLRREVLHILATEPKTFSKVVIEHLLPESQLFAKISIEEAAKSVGDFRKPTKTAPGIFYLKNDVRNEYNSFFYHYTKTDVSNADQYRQKEAAVAAPPMPPPFEPFYQPITNLLCSKTMMHLFSIVLARTARRSRFSGDGLFHRVLFLIGMGLNEQISNKNFDFITCAEKVKIFEMMKALVGKPESESHADLLQYTLELYETINLSKNAESQRNLKMETSDLEMKTRKAATAAKKRKQAMDQMIRLQKQFVTQNKEFLGKEYSEEMESQRQDCSEEPIGILPEGSGFPICLGINRTIAKYNFCRRITCILCQEEEYVKESGQAIVCVGFMQRSSLFSKVKQDKKESDLSEIFVPAALRSGGEASTCGHLMHFNCYKKFSELIRDRDRGRNRQPLAFNPRVVDVSLGEYLCPLCKRLSNTILPVLPPLLQDSMERVEPEKNCIEFADWLNNWLGTFADVRKTKAGKPFKGFNRKRSHSERSLMDLGSTDNGAENPLSVSVPSTSVMSLTEKNSTQSDVEQVMEMASSDVKSEKKNVERESSSDGKFLSILSSFPDLMHKIRDMLTHPEKQQSDSFLDNFQHADTFFCGNLGDGQLFYERNRHLQNEGLPDYFNQEILGTLYTFQTTAFSLRSIATVLRHTGKPLFGAWNARQRECIYGLSRTCAAMTMKCYSSFDYQRILLLQLLSPLLLSTDRANDQISSALPNSQSSNNRSLSEALDERRKAVNSMLNTGGINKAQLELAVMILIEENIKEPPNILAIDMLSLAVELAMCEGWDRINENGEDGNKLKSRRLPHGSYNEQYMVRLALIGHLYQVMATFDTKSISQKCTVSPFATCDDRMLNDILLRLYAIVHPGQRLHSVATLKEVCLQVI
ncbi:unnamed protein product [Thelazia callipaeda]|uniref:E3 ubiquitin-protein ligase n=1 Tax=Thelazia callipaeda TaxID=103827 RepID=A0A158RBP8_THECL|nr:unnamed protein product [Thelazia callipaeda]